MFGFIRKKIKSFTDAFSEEAEEEVVEETVEETVETTPTASEAVERTLDQPESIEQVEAEVSDSAVDESASPKDSSDTEPSPREVAEPERVRDTQSVRKTQVSESSESEKEAVSDVVDEPSEEQASTVQATADDSATASRDENALESESKTEEPAIDETKPEKRGLRERFMGALTKRTLSDERFDTLFQDLEIGLLEANTAYDAVQAVKENLRERLTGERVSRFSAAADVSQALKESIAELFEEPEDLVALADSQQPLVIMLIGINGSGKTTSAAKLAHAFQKAGKRPVLAAADTFRAAAIQQLEAHANALDCRIIKHDYGADPAAVAFDAIAHAKSGKADVVLIDTAGRLHSNENLLKELEKVKRVAKPDRIIFVGESIAGNDLLEQAETFNDRVGIDGIILTKADVDESGGGALSVSYVTKKPIDYFGSGQSYDDLEPFTIDRMAQLLGLE